MATRVVAACVASAFLLCSVDAECVATDGECTAAYGQGLLQLGQKTSKDIKVSDSDLRQKQTITVMPEKLTFVLPSKNVSMRRSERSMLLRARRQTAGVPASMQEVFDAHNVYRCMHGVPLFTWDDAIAAQAQAWADAGNYGHGSTAERTLDGYGVLGENLAWGSPSRTGLDSVSAWYDEIVDTANGGAPTGCDDWAPGSEGAALCHYTQVVWRSSTLLGCGQGRATIDHPTHGPMEGDYWVCQYSPAGNMQGAFDNNVNAPVLSASECQANTSAPAPTPGPAPAPSPSPSPSPPPPTTTAAPATCENAVDGDTNDSPLIHLGDGVPLSCQELAPYCSSGSVWDKCMLTCQCTTAPCADGEADVSPIIHFGDGVPVPCPDLAGFCSHGFVSDKCLETCGHC